MKTVAITGERQFRLADRPKPKAWRNYAVIENRVAPMCTEYKAYAGGSVSEFLGHEAAGQVVEIAQPGRVKVGDRVVAMPLHGCGACELCLSGDYIHCQAGLDPLKLTGNQAGTATYAQYLFKLDWLLLPIPDSVSLEHGSMACCGLGPTFGAMQIMNVNAFDTLLIAGLGPVGLGGVINGTYRGATVIAVEPHPYRRRLASELGAHAVLDPAEAGVEHRILDLTSGRGADKAIDCSGAPQAQRLLIDSLRRKAQMCFVGEGGDLTLGVSRDMIRKGISLTGSWHYRLSDFPRLMRVVVDSKAKLDRLITHSFAIEEVQKAWELQLRGECGKILLYPWQRSSG